MLAPVQLDWLDAIPPLRSKRHQDFVAAILAGKPHAEALRLAGSKARGRSADTIASRWLNRVDIDAHLKLQRKLAVETANVTATQVIREAALIAFAADFGPREKVRAGEKISALRMLAEYLGLLKGDGATVNVTAAAAVGCDPLAIDDARRIQALQDFMARIEHKQPEPELTDAQYEIALRDFEAMTNGSKS